MLADGRAVPWRQGYQTASVLALVPGVRLRSDYPLPGERLEPNHIEVGFDTMRRSPGECSIVAA
jgi:hypothetical protein